MTTPDLQALIELPNLPEAGYQEGLMADHPDLFTAEQMREYGKQCANHSTLPGAGGGEWLPIESAPKDGSVILAWRFYLVAIMWTGDSEYPWDAINLGSHSSTAMLTNRFMDGDNNLTHWMPLPPNPAALPPQQGG